jgi:hypothetical protein
MAAVDNFMADIDRGTVLLERQIHDIDRSIDPGAKSPRIGKVYLHSDSCSFDG